MKKRLFLVLLPLLLLFFIYCSNDDSDEPTNPDQMAYICSKGICNDFYSIKSATDYTDGFEPDWEPGGGKAQNASKDDPTYDTLTGWWQVHRECNEGIITYCFAESVKFIDTLGSFQKEPNGLEMFFHRMHFVFGLDSMNMSGHHNFTFSGLDLDSTRVDTSVIEGSADWVISLSELEFSNTIIYNELTWIWNDENVYCYNEYPESGSYSVIINGDWNANLEFNGTNIADFSITDGDNTWNYQLNMETGVVIYISGPA
ncbi:hypothetical protein JXI42_06480 [bacterium]|nr:hypothetical protein [bacterium]